MNYSRRFFPLLRVIVLQLVILLADHAVYAEDGLADAVRSLLVPSSGAATIWNTVQFDTPELNTPSATVGTAWEDGLYDIHGSVIVQKGAGGGHGTYSARLLVNGDVREMVSEKIEGASALGTLSYSLNTLLSDGDVVELQVRGSNDSLSWFGLDGQGDFNMVKYNAVPEPSTAMLFACGVLWTFFRLQRRDTR